MRRAAISGVVMLLVAATASAVTPGRDLFIPSVGRLKGACTKGVCAQFRTDVWVYGAAPGAIDVTVAFLKRDTENSTPAATYTFGLFGGQTVELGDIFDSAFHLDGVAGALRVTATADVVATARVYDANVQTNIGTGTAGQFYEGIPAGQALGPGESTTVIGLAEEGGIWRSNLAVIETTGGVAHLWIERYDAAGQALGTNSGYPVRGFEAKQINRVLQSLGGAGTMANQRVRVQVQPGSTGKVLVAASRIDSRTGDPFTIGMVGEPPADEVDRRRGTFMGAFTNPDPALVDGGIRLTIGSLGLLRYAGIVALPCGESSVVLDIGGEFSSGEVPVGVNGEFGSGESSSGYSGGDGSTLTLSCTIFGAIHADGTVTGTIESIAAGGTGAWAGCNGQLSLPFTAAWVSPSDGE